MIVPIVEARNTTSLYKEAKNYLEEGSSDMAFMFFRQILNEYPKSKYADEALFRVAEFYFDNKSFRSAEDRLAKYVKKYPEGQFIERAKEHLNKIRLGKIIAEADNLYQKGSYEEAIEVYSQAMELTSEKKAIKDKIKQCRQKHINEKVDEADKLYKKENWHKALALYNEIIKNNPDLVDVKEKIKKCKENVEFEKKQIAKGLVKYKGAWMDQETLERLVNKEMTTSSKTYIKGEGPGAFGSTTKKITSKGISMHEAEQEISSRLKFKVWQLKSIPYKDGFLICGYNTYAPIAIGIWWCDGQKIFNVNGIARSNIKEFKLARSMIDYISDVLSVCKEHKNRKVHFDKNKKFYKSSVIPQEKFGLSEKQRKAVVKELAEIVNKACHESRRAYPPDDYSLGFSAYSMSQNIKRIDLDDKLFYNYRDELLDKYGLTSGELEAIEEEGIEKNWDYLVDTTCLF